MKKIYVDGHLIGKNDGTASAGFTRVIVEGKRQDIEYIKPNLTNNEAELFAIAHALLLFEAGSTICSDSEWTVKVLRGEYKVKQERLQPLVYLIKSLLKIKDSKVVWIPRKENPAT